MTSFAESRSWNFCGRRGVNSATALRTGAGSNEDISRNDSGMSQEINRTRKVHDKSSMRTLSGQLRFADTSRTSPDRGRGQSESVDCPRTVRVRCQCLTVDCPDCCLYADADSSRTCLWTWTVRGRDLSVAGSATWTVRVRMDKSLFSRGHAASPPRLLRGHEDLPPGRGNACPV